MFSATHGARTQLRPGAPMVPPQMVHSPGNQMMTNHSAGQMPGTPQMGPGTPQMAPGTPQMGPGTPQMGPGNSQMGPGTPQMGPGTPQMGQGTPQMGTNVPQMPSPRLASAPNQLSPGTPQMPNISQGMSIPSPQQMAMAQQRAIAPKLEPPDTMDARAMWLPKRMNHCKLMFLFCTSFQKLITFVLFFMFICRLKSIYLVPCCTFLIIFSCYASQYVTGWYNTVT